MEETGGRCEGAQKEPARRVGRCVLCREVIYASGETTDGVLVPMQGRWAVAAHRDCWVSVAGARP